MPVFEWSPVPNNNASADSTINYEINMAPSAVGSSARASMAAIAEWRDDISGSIVTTGTSTAYLVSSNSNFDTLAHLNNQMIAFQPHTTNGATVTLSIDGLGAKPLRSSPGVELLAGTIIQGTPYVCFYNNTDGAFYLRDYFGNPYGIPLAAGLPYFATSPPNSAFAFPFGQAVSRTGATAPLFAILATNFGAGDGSTTFNLPDLRGRVPAGWDAMGGTPASRLTAASGFGGLFTAAGAETETLTLAQLPTGITSTGTVNVQSSTNTFLQSPGSVVAVQSGAGAQGTSGSSALGFVNSSGTATLTSNNTSGAAHVNAQPTIQINYIMRII